LHHSLLLSDRILVRAPLFAEATIDEKETVTERRPEQNMSSRVQNNCEIVLLDDSASL
jgi:hypothetical protein